MQIAAALGAIVTGVDASHRGVVRRMGAATFLDYRQHDVTELTERFDLIFDMAPSSSVRRMQALLSPGGRYAKGNPRLTTLVRAPFTSRFGGNRMHVAFATETRDVLRELATMIDDGTIGPIVNRVLPLDRAAEAHRLVESDERIGAIVLAVGPRAEDRCGGSPATGPSGLTWPWRSLFPRTSKATHQCRSHSPCSTSQPECRQALGCLAISSEALATALVLTREDGAADTIRPRLEAAAAKKQHDGRNTGSAKPTSRRGTRVTQRNRPKEGAFSRETAPFDRLSSDGTNRAPFEGNGLRDRERRRGRRGHKVGLSLPRALWRSTVSTVM